MNLANNGSFTVNEEGATERGAAKFWEKPLSARHGKRSTALGHHQHSLGGNYTHDPLGLHVIIFQFLFVR